MLSKAQRPEVTGLTPTEVRSWNQHAARKCNELVVGEPGRVTALDAVEMHIQGPRIRFNTGPLLERDDNGQRVRTDKEILHMWVCEGLTWNPAVSRGDDDLHDGTQRHSLADPDTKG